MQSGVPAGCLVQYTEGPLCILSGEIAGLWIGLRASYASSISTSPLHPPQKWQLDFILYGFIRRKLRPNAVERQYYLVHSVYAEVPVSLL